MEEEKEAEEEAVEDLFSCFAVSSASPYCTAAQQGQGVHYDTRGMASEKLPNPETEPSNGKGEKHGVRARIAESA